MPHDIQPADLLEIVKKQNVIVNAELIPVENASLSASQIKRSDYPYKTFIKGDIQISGKSAVILLAFDSFFPSSIPIAFLLDPTYLGFIPHIERDGFICFIEKEGTLVNSESVANLVHETIEKIRNTLTESVRSVAGKDYNDFFNEFESYWRDPEQEAGLFSLINLDEDARIVCESHFSKNPPIRNIKSIICDSGESLKEFIYKEFGKDFFQDLPIENALYLPLIKPVLPPVYGTFWDVNEISDLLSTHVSLNNHKKVKQLLRKLLDRANFDVFLSFPKPKGGKACFGVKIKINSPVKSKKKNNLSLINDATCSSITVKRLDKEVLIPRGGGMLNIQEKKILIIGCGSLGGYIAEEIAKTGIQNLTLVDPDLINQENAYRHLAGIPYIGMSKVDAIKNILERYLIHPQVSAIRNNAKNFFEEYIEKIGIDLGIYNLIIVATGDPNIDRFINAYVHEKPNSPSTIFAWVEPYGIGGQALLTNNANRKGCLECLYQKDKDYNKALFLKRTDPPQTFTQSVSGCSGLFTPFGSLDARQTAVLVTRLALRVINGQEVDNPIHSWKGDGNAFRNAGKITSDRYDLSEEQLKTAQYEYKDPSCSVCGKKTAE